MRFAPSLWLAAACASQPPPTPASPAWEMTGGLEHGMMNCPSAVEGAITRLVLTRDGVDVIVTAADPLARAELLALAGYHTRIGSPPTEWPEHSGHHGGPGTIGHCPVIHDRTAVSMSTHRDGITLHVTTAVPGHAEDVQQQTTQRLASLPRWLPH